jgi:hypothetical protein
VNRPTHALVALLALVGACRSTADCKPGTLLLAVELGPAGEQVTRVSVRVRGAGDRLLTSGELDRPAGQRSGTIEVSFAGGYPAGETVLIEVEARQGNQALARGSMSARLAAGCAALTLSLAGADGSARLPDARVPDGGAGVEEDAAPSADADIPSGDAAPPDATTTDATATDATSTDAASDAGVDAAPDVSQPPDALQSVGERRVFVTSTRHTGNLGGLAGAHAICQALADAAGLGGRYQAWLGAGFNGPAGAMVHSTVPYVLVTGTKVAENWNDLTDGSLRHAIDRDERGQDIQPKPFVCKGGEVWSNATTAGGVQNALADCVGWTSTSGSSSIGHLDRGDQRWTEGECTSTCQSDLPLYCFEQ